MNPIYMRDQCAKTCGSCKGIDLRVRTPLHTRAQAHETDATSKTVLALVAATRCEY